MISDLVVIHFTLSLAILFVLAASPVAARIADGQSAYLLWWIVPFVFIINFLPLTQLSSQVVKVLPDAHNATQQVISRASGGDISVWLSLYCIGVMVTALVLWRAHRKALLKAKIDPADSVFYQRLSKLSPTLKQTSIRIGVSHSQGPFTYGLWPAKMVLPADFFERFDCSQQRFIVEHELTHIRRRDCLVNCLALVLLSLFWLNPLMWIAIRQFRFDQELACDQRVLRNSTKSQRVDYAKAMLTCVEEQDLRFNLINHYGSRTKMKNRIQYLARHVNSVWYKKFTAVGVVAFATLLATGVTAGLSHSGDTVSPVMRVEPVYPIEAAKQELEGTVVVQFDILSSGKVDNVSVIASQPAGVFDKSAVTAVSQWVYTKSTQTISNTQVQLDYLLSKPDTALGQSTAPLEREKVNVTKS